MSTLQAIKFDRENLSLSVLDQLLLPYTTKYIPVNTISDAFDVIKKMQVRGAPAIAIVGALAVIMEVSMFTGGKFTNQSFYDVNDFNNFKSQLVSRLHYLIESRPTAVNLSNAINEIIEIIESSSEISSVDQLYAKIFDFGTKLIDDDYSNNVKLGENGKDWILKSLHSEGFTGEFSILTICNTGSLATSGYGTALGVVRSLWKDTLKKHGVKEGEEPRHKRAKLEGEITMSRAYPLETRPYNQGARLTAYELVYEEIPSTLITDSMVTYLISSLNKNKENQAPIKACVVGADRIVKNGDTANKIGTYQLALICKQFGIKFLVVAPKTTIDRKTETGDEIVVEQRPANELRFVSGGVIDSQTGEVVRDQHGNPVNGKVGVAAPGIEIWNPSFDVTPHELIDGIVTEDGVIEKVDGVFDLESLF